MKKKKKIDFEGHLFLVAHVRVNMWDVILELKRLNENILSFLYTGVK